MSDPWAMFNPVERRASAQPAPAPASGDDPWAAFKPVGDPKPAAEPVSTARGIGFGMGDILHGGSQFLANAVPSGVLDAVNSGVQAVNEAPIIGPITKALGMTPATPTDIGKTITEREKVYQAARAAAGDTGTDWARIGGQAIPGIAMTVAAPVLGASLPAAIAAGALSGGALSALNPVMDQAKPYWNQKAQQIAEGAGVGAVAGPIGYGVGRAISGARNVAPEIRALADRGVSLTPGQMLGGAVRRIEDAATSIPMIGDAVIEAKRAGIGTFNKVAIDEALAPIGSKVPANLSGREAVEFAQDAVSGAYQAVLPRMTGALDRDFADALKSLSAMASDLPEQQAKQFEKIVKTQIAGKFAPSGTMDGDTLKGVESELGRLIRAYKADPSADNKMLGDALTQLQIEFRDMLGRINPGEAPALKAANAAFRNLLAPTKASVAAADGVFSPSQLQTAIRQMDSTGRKRAFSRGDAPLQELADQARKVLPSTVPDSGTVSRALVGGGLLGGATAYTGDPTLLLGAAGMYGAYTPLARKLLQSIIMGQRPAALGAAGDVIARSGGTVSTPLAMSLINGGGS